MVVNENSIAYLTVRFLDKDGIDAIPVSLAYSVHCMTNSQEVRASTALTPGVSVEISMTPDDNAIITDTNQFETRRVIVVATYGTDDAMEAYYDYLVKNLSLL